VRIILKNLILLLYKAYKEGKDEALWSDVLTNCFSSRRLTLFLRTPQWREMFSPSGYSARFHLVRHRYLAPRRLLGNYCEEWFWLGCVGCMQTVVEAYSCLLKSRHKDKDSLWKISSDEQVFVVPVSGVYKWW